MGNSHDVAGLLPILKKSKNKIIEFFTTYLQ